VGNIAFGYRLSSDGVHVEPEPTEQATIAAVAELRSNGMSLRRIAKDLNRRGIRTRKGSEWRLESVARVASANARSLA